MLNTFRLTFFPLLVKEATVIKLPKQVLRLCYS